MLSDVEHNKFMQDQIAAMEEYKLDQEAEAGRELGDKPFFEWIEKESAEFRRRWLDAHN